MILSGRILVLQKAATRRIMANVGIRDSYLSSSLLSPTSGDCHKPINLQQRMPHRMDVFTQRQEIHGLGLRYGNNSDIHTLVQATQDPDEFYSAIYETS